MKKPLNFQHIRNWLRDKLDRGYGQSTSEMGSMERREEVTVFILSFVIALVMWFVVSLGKELSTTVSMDLTVGVLPEDRALVNELPQAVNASVSGEGWRLLSLRNNPPVIAIDINQAEVPLTDMIREKVGPLGLNVLAVQPPVIRTVLEQRISKKVPVLIDDDISFRGQHGLVGSLSVIPDSITISGAQSVVQRINSWSTMPLVLDNVNTSISMPVTLVPPPEIITLQTSEVRVQAAVSEYTEGEQRVRVDAIGLPEGLGITFNPAYITIRYSVPIEKYVHTRSQPIFSAVARYSDIAADSTGYIAPMITILSDTLHARIRLVQPRTVSYFKVVR